MLKQILVSAAMLTVSTVVMAGSADDANAHFKAVAAGNVAQIMQGYADNAALL